MTDFSRHKYHTLDGIRGIAALLIVLRHAGDYFGGISFTESYLAVDLFFVLSGFVIAEAYAERLASGLSCVDFMRVRLIRLYPLYLLGTLLGIIYYSTGIMLGYKAPVTASELAVASILAMVMLPSPLSPSLYPVNGPSWSLLFELLSNGLYAISHPKLTTSRLLIALAVSAIVLGVLVYIKGNLDVGFNWKHFFMGIPRVIYSFGAGLLIQRIQFRNFPLQLPSWVLMVFVLAILCYSPATQARSWYDMLAVTILFPGVVYLASTSEPGSVMAVRCYAFLGSVSYAIYVLHVPISQSIRAALKVSLKSDVAQLAPISGVILLFGLVLFSWIMDCVYDRPVRRIASKLFLEK